MSFSFKPRTDSPSTPNRKNNRSLISQPSTTPAGPPPSWLTNQSTTPADPPPRKQLFNSSFNPSDNTFGRRGNTPGRRGFAVPESSPPQDRFDDDEAEVEDDEEMDDTRHHPQSVAPELNQSAFLNSMLSSPRGLKRSRNGQIRESQAQDNLAAIARGITGHAREAQLSEPDALLVREEQVLSRLNSAQKGDAQATQEAAAALTNLWEQYTDTETKEGTIGPMADSSFAKANYIASLLLQLRHPHRLRPIPPSNAYRDNFLSKANASSVSPIPRALLDWLDVYHNPFPDDFDIVSRHQPDPTNHERFWDTIFVCITRGRFKRVIELFQQSDWQRAATAEEDGQPDGYSDQQVDNIDEVIETCVRLLRNSPAVRYDDWDVKGSDWEAFRQRVRAAIKDLEQFAGEEDDSDGMTRSQPNIFSVSAASRKAESKVPWSIYTNLKLVYDLLLGKSDELIDASQDWLEASIYMTVWWEGDDAESEGLANSRGSLRKSISASQRAREVDIAPVAAYQKRLAEAFVYVTETDDALFVPDTMDPVQVALGCVMAGHTESVIELLHMWSLPIAAGVVQIAAFAGWLPYSRHRGRGLIEQGFSSEDLMVLSHGADTELNKSGHFDGDQVLSDYADELAAKKTFQDNKTQREGWELAVPMLGRLTDEQLAQRKISELIGQIELTDEARVDRVLKVCSELSLTDESKSIAERYADTLAETTQSYGLALIYYARANATHKLKSTLALLTSLCLLHSAAIPAEADLDPQLASLLSSDRHALIALSQIDAEAASTLASHLSGYALLRTFFDLRDRDLIATSSATAPALRPLARARKAASTLVHILASASDCIHGGLFDPEIESVVPVDGVLALLGEALPLLGQTKRIFTQQQVYTLLRIVEDFDTVSGRIRQNAENLLQASITAYRSGASSDHGLNSLLKKSRSDASSNSGSAGLSGSSWEMLAESTMSMATKSSQEKPVELKRAWDWRKGLDGLDSKTEVGAQEVLGLVRVALAREVARGWVGEVRWVTDEL